MNLPAGVKYAVHSRGWWGWVYVCWWGLGGQQSLIKGHTGLMYDRGVWGGSGKVDAFTYFEPLFFDSVSSVDAFIVIFLEWDSVAALFQLAGHHSLDQIHLVGRLHKGRVKLGGDAGETVCGWQQRVKSRGWSLQSFLNIAADLVTCECEICVQLFSVSVWLCDRSLTVSCFGFIVVLLLC